MTHTVTREIRAVPLWLLEEYVEGAGARRTGPGRLEADGIRVTLEQIDDFAVGSLSVGQVRLTATGDEAAVEALMRAVEPKLVRAGG